MSSNDEAQRTHAWEAEAVAGLRYDLGLSQGEFSRILGVRQQTVSEWETGLHSPRGASRRMLSIVAEQRAAYVTAPRHTSGKTHP